MASSHQRPCRTLLRLPCSARCFHPSFLPLSLLHSESDLHSCLPALPISSHSLPSSLMGISLNTSLVCLTQPWHLLFREPEPTHQVTNNARCAIQFWPMRCHGKSEVELGEASRKLCFVLRKWTHSRTILFSSLGTGVDPDFVGPKVYKVKYLL